MFLDTQSVRSAYYRALTAILCKSRDRLTLEVLQKFSPYSDEDLEEYQFSKIHKWILGLAPFQMPEDLVALSAEGDQVNQVDSQRRTAIRLCGHRIEMYKTGDLCGRSSQLYTCGRLALQGYQVHRTDVE